MPEDNDGFGDYFSSFLETVKPGSRVRDFDMMRYRQGGDPSDWSYPGAAKYLPGDWEMIGGAQKWTGAAATSGSEQITMPIEFADGFLVLAVPVATTPNFEDVRLMCSISTNKIFVVRWWSTNNLTRVQFNWLAWGAITLN